MRRILVAAALLLVAVPAAGGDEAYDSSAALMGGALFKTYCASCHGKTGEGDGPLSASLRVAPPDLRRIARREGGKFPFDKVYRIVDGREPVKGHGGADMPVWGDAFLQSRDGYSADRVRERITQLTHYLASLQEATAK
ncbi:MAG: cytochrome c [Acidobacteria bacterium]|nr:cytochrome c [Acidobacteriota bacterium]